MSQAESDLVLRAHILELEDQCKAAGEDLDSIKSFYSKAISEKEDEVEAASRRMMRLHEEVVVPSYVRHAIVNYYEERIRKLEESLCGSLPTRDLIKKIDQLVETLKKSK